MDAFLDLIELYRSDVAKDGSCLFRVVSEQLFFTQIHHVKLRECCVDYMERNRSMFEPLVDLNFDEYLEKIRNPKEWAGEVEMKALSLKYKLEFVVYHEINIPPIKIKGNTCIQTITLVCTGNNRYDCVYPKNDLPALAFSQSIVYEILYKKVFDLGSDVDIAVEKMLHDKAYSKQRRNNLLCHYFRESCRIDGAIDDPNLPEDDQADLKNSQSPKLEIRKALAQGVPPFPYKVAKTLDAGIYRNVEFDMWNEKRKEEQKNEQFIIPKLDAGVRCKVHINKEILTGHVQEVFNDDEKVFIYIEELRKKCFVPSKVLEVVPVPVYKALTWQGGKTYKVYSDNAIPSDGDKKCKKGPRKNYQEYSTTQNTSTKQGAITRSNSMPSHFMHRSSYAKNNNSQFSRKKSYSTSISTGHKHKNNLQRNLPNVPPVFPQNIQYFWNGIPQNLATQPIPISGKTSPDYTLGNPESPQKMNDFHDSSWADESFKYDTSIPSTPQYTFATYADVAYSPLPPNSPYTVVSTNATSLPLAIPGTQNDSPPPSEEVCTSPMQQSAQCPATMALYPYPVYAVPSMYLMCRDGSSLPLNISGPWVPPEAVAGGEVPPGVPSMYFNTPPGGLSPPITSWIPATMANYGPNWSATMPPTTIAFTPPMEMNAFQPIIPPQWNTSGIYIPPPTSSPVPYPMQPRQESS